MDVSWIIWKQQKLDKQNDKVLYFAWNEEQIRDPSLKKSVKAAGAFFSPRRGGCIRSYMGRVPLTSLSMI